MPRAVLLPLLYAAAFLVVMGLIIVIALPALSLSRESIVLLFCASIAAGAMVGKHAV